MAMKAIDRTFKRVYTVTVDDTPVEKQEYEMVVIADTFPGTMPTDGTNVDGMRASETFATGSIMFACDTQTVAVVNASGNWVIPE